MQPALLRPVRVLFRQKHMTSLLAVRQRAWMVFFIGTGDGQLIKVSMESNIENSRRILSFHRTSGSAMPHAENSPVTLIWSQNMPVITLSAAN